MQHILKEVCDPGNKVVSTPSAVNDTARTQPAHSTKRVQTTPATHTDSSTPVTLTQAHLPIPDTTARNVCTINLLSLNVCGLKSKLFVDEFTGFLKDFDVICMSETT